MTRQSAIISAAVEGLVDEAVVRRLIAEVGAVCGQVYGANGKTALLKRIEGYNNAAHRSPWFVVVDLDLDHTCAPQARLVWLPNPASGMCLRIAVRAVEAWLLADAQNLSAFLGISARLVPDDPEALQNPKLEVVNLARFSRRRAIRQDMVPDARSGRQVGPAYTSRMIEFVRGPWSPLQAAKRSDSLNRAIQCLRKRSRQ